MPRLRLPATCSRQAAEAADHNSCKQRVDRVDLVDLVDGVDLVDLVTPLALVALVDRRMNFSESDAHVASFTSASAAAGSWW